MREESKKQLSTILADLEKEREEARVEAGKEQGEQQLFLYYFEEICREKIEPIMKDTALILSKHHYDCPIEYHNDERRGANGYKPPYIQMSVVRSLLENKYYNVDKYPHIKFIGDKTSKKIQIHESTITPSNGGQSGMKEIIYTLESLTEEKIEKEMIDSIENILKNKY